MLTLAQAATALKEGKVIAYPTEAVYGLVCDPMNEQAVTHIWNIKNRSEGMGLIVVGSSWQQLEPYMGRLTDDQQQRLKTSWPAALTWIVPATESPPLWLTGGRNTIALRWTNHPTSIELCNAFGRAIVSTSANIHGVAPCVTINCLEQTFLHVGSVFAGTVQGVLGDHIRPTPIRDLVTGNWIRT
jgi:L-threonylcarbamoyladenylate synthase